MPKSFLALTTFAVLLCFGFSANAQDAKRLSKMEAGEVIVDTIASKGSDIPKLMATAIFNAPPEKLWNIIEKCNNYTKTMKGLKFAKELSRKGNTVRCKTTADLPWPLDDLTATTDATHTVVEGKMYKRAWKLVSGDFKFNNGSWVLTSYKGGRTMAIYSIHVQPTTSVPDSLKASIQKSIVPDLFEHLRKQVE